MAFVEFLRDSMTVETRRGDVRGATLRVAGGIYSAATTETSPRDQNTNRRCVPVSGFQDADLTYDIQDEQSYAIS
jgi:hypothetical protein